MARIVGIHKIELLPGVDPAEFERFVIEEFFPKNLFKGWHHRLGKADRGVRAGKHVIIVESDTAARDRYAPGVNQLSAEGQQVVEALAGVLAAFATYAATVPGRNTIFSDYQIIGT